MHQTRLANSVDINRPIAFQVLAPPWKSWQH